MLVRHGGHAGAPRCAPIFPRTANQILDGLLFGLGILAVYLGAVLTGAIIRSLGGAGSKGLTVLGRYATGWFDYVRGDDRNTINVTLNMVVDGHLKFDTIVADRRIWYVWPNQYRVYLIRRAAKLHHDRQSGHRVSGSAPGAQRRGLGERITDMLASVKVTENGRSQRVRLIREDDYRATYAPLISLISEKCTNDNSIDLALGRPMDEHRFVIALTFEQLNTPPRAPPARDGDVGADAAQPARRDAARRFRGAQDALPHAAGDRATYRAHPERFGIVKVWRPKRPHAADLASIVPDAALAARG